MTTVTLRDLGAKHPCIRADLRKPSRKDHPCRHIVSAGALTYGVGLAIQFSTDCRTYNVWEALLYVEGYERNGHYAPGTAVKAFLSMVKS